MFRQDKDYILANYQVETEDYYNMIIGEFDDTNDPVKVEYPKRDSILAPVVSRLKKEGYKVAYRNGYLEVSKGEL